MKQMFEFRKFLDRRRKTVQQWIEDNSILTQLDLEQALLNDNLLLTAIDKSEIDSLLPLPAPLGFFSIETTTAELSLESEKQVDDKKDQKKLSKKQKEIE